MYSLCHCIIGKKFTSFKPLKISLFDTAIPHRKVKNV